MSQTEAAWNGRQRGGVLGHGIFRLLLTWAGRDLAGGLLVPVSAYFLLAAPKARKASQEFLQACARYWQWAGRPSVFSHFLAFAQVLLDRAALVAGSGGRFTFSFTGEEHIRRAWQRKKGVVLVSAHLGNWEAAARELQQRLPDCRIRVARFEAAGAAPATEGAISLSAADGPVQMLAALRQGDIVAMHGDRFLPGARTLSLPFLGQTARFPEGPFHLAALAGCPVITCFNLRQGRRAYGFLAYPAEILPADKTGRARAVEQAVRQYVIRLESMVRQAPLQWFNFYSFWS